jgi:hypothetical protein
MLVARISFCPTCGVKLPHSHYLILSDVVTFECCEVTMTLVENPKRKADR